MIGRLSVRSLDLGGAVARRWPAPGVRPGEHRHRARHRQGRAGRRHSRRDGHADQRGARHPVRAGRDQRERRFRVRQRDGRHLHRRGHARVVQDLAALGDRGQPRHARHGRHPHARSRRRHARRSSSRAKHHRFSRPPASARSSVTTAEVTNLPIATRNFADFINLTPGVVNGNRAGDSPSTGGGSNNFMMDGVSTMEPGSNRLMIAVNVESISEVKVLTSSYQAEYGRSSGLQVTAVTKSGTNRFSGSRLRRRTQFGLVLEQPDQHPERRSEDDVEAAGLGLLDRRTGREAGRQQQAVLLLRAGVSAAHHRQRRRPLPGADRARAAGRLLADHRQQRQPVPVHQGSAARRGTCSATSHGGVLRRWRRASGRIPANRLYQTGQNILNLYPLPNITNVPAGQNYNYELTRPEQSLTSWQPVVRIDYQPFTALRGTFKYAAWGQPTEPILGSLPGFNDTQMNDPGRAALVGDGELHPQSDDVPRGELRARLAPPGGLRAQRQRRQFLHRRIPGEPGRQPADQRAGRPAEPVPGREHRRSELLPVRGPERGEAGELRRHPGAPAAGVPVGRPGRGERAAEQRLSRLRRLLGGQRFRGQRDQGLGPAHHQDRLLPADSRQAAESGQPVRHAQLRQRRQQPARLRVRVRQCRARHLHVLHPGVAGSSKGSTSTPTTRPTSRTTGR